MRSQAARRLSSRASVIQDLARYAVSRPTLPEACTSSLRSCAIRLSSCLTEPADEPCQPPQFLDWQPGPARRLGGLVRVAGNSHADLDSRNSRSANSESMPGDKSEIDALFSIFLARTAKRSEDKVSEAWILLDLKKWLVGLAWRTLALKV